ncbi:MAG: FRG domain-containing protein, partial [Candidatus Acidiferrales bacterium]
MNIRNLRATNVPEFLAAIRDLTAPWFTERTWGPWFRGQRQASWDLIPSLYRFDPPWDRSIRVLEDEIRQEFEVRAPSLTSERPRNMWEWYALMQHCGAPTRLLDWTEGALIALYFAVRDKPIEATDAAVWVLDPWELNRATVKVAEVIAPGAGGVLKDHADRYKHRLPARYEIEKDLAVELPAAIYPTHFDRRISSQRSCFTIHGSARDGFNLLPTVAKDRLAKVLIPGPAAREIDHSLSIAGVD